MTSFSATADSQPEQAWEVDLKDMESQIDANTAAIVVVNPSNPCGSVYSEQHLKDIVALAERRRLPIIADETYAWMVSLEYVHSVFGINIIQCAISPTC